MAEVFLAVNKGPESFLKVVVLKRVLQHLTRNPPIAQTRSLNSNVDVPVGVTSARQIALTAIRGRLIVSGLPAGTSLIVDAVEYAAGDVIAVAAGNHAVRVVLDGRTLAEQSITTGAGDQTWRLNRDKLISN